MSSHILTIRRFLEGVHAKILDATILFVYFSMAIDLIHRGNMEQILLANGLHRETFTAKMTLYKNTKVNVNSPMSTHSSLTFYQVCSKETFSPIFIYHLRDIGPAVRVFANGPGDLGSIPGRVIPKTLKMELDTTLLNTQHYKVRFKGKVEQSREWSSALPYTLV